MAIAKMTRFTLLTFHEHKAELLKQLQVFGDVHLKSPGQDELTELDFLRSDFSQEQLGRYEIELEKVRYAVAKLAPYAEKPKMTEKRPALTFEEFDRYAGSYDYGTVYEKVKEQDEAIAAIKAESARRAAESDGMAPWVNLDVSPEELEGLTATASLIGTVNRQTAEEFFAKLGESFDTVYAEQLDTVKDDVTLLLLFPAEILDEVSAFVRELGFTRAAFQLRGKPADIVEENQKTIRSLAADQQKAEDALKALAPEHPKLQIALDYFESVLERESASRNFLASDTTLLIEGWVPDDDASKLREILEKVCAGEYFLEAREVERDSVEVPIKLKNNKFVTAFESITSMYSMPKYNEIDPTPILAPFYWLFFGMMVGDIGFGLVLLVATTLAPRIIDMKPGMKDFMKFFQYLSIAVIGAGVLYGGAFGETIFKPITYVDELGQVGKKAILDSQLDIVTMLVISIIIGLVHIFVGLGTKAYMGFRDGKPFDGFCDGILWIITLASGIGWLLGGAGFVDGIAGICQAVFWISIAGLALTQGRESPSLGGKIGNGLYGVYGITGYVGDIVSYTRIVALALSGAYIGFAFNLMGGLIPGALKWVFGALIIIFGQALNLGLALLGAYVHSCRLQYVEFFGKFYEGGGVPFKPLSLKSEYVHIKK